MVKFIEISNSIVSVRTNIAIFTKSIDFLFIYFSHKLSLFWDKKELLIYISLYILLRLCVSSRVSFIYLGQKATPILALSQ